ncbi:flagellar hook-associated protein FlgK [Bartonella bovis]|uniref:Flagellar hook-associated protein 1 n=1 Tax=Bartonella bovis m02 TaxID=1094492 RepID=N6UI20_9HYPH|nr:flagellar hook-associated protein FlgK [Bartonella bovis]ENN89893.1 flagellar hook-associated protein FlgK [Bartonella bovis m02]
MAFNSTINTARNSLKATTGQLSIASQNVVGAQDPNYVRRTSYIESGPRGTIHLMVRRDGDVHLLDHYLVKSSQAAVAGSIANGLNRLSNIYGVDEFSRAPSQLLSDFQKALQTYANNPQHRAAGDVAVDRARDLAYSLNEGNREIEKLRNDADSDIQDSVDHINDLLRQFHDLDQHVVREKNAGRGDSIYMDQRDAVLKALSQEIGINTAYHSDGSMTIYGMDDSALYDKIPQEVTFQSSNFLPAGVVGKKVFVDGVPLGHPSFVDLNGGGNLGGLLRIRDEIAPQYQKQLDEMTNALMQMFPGPPSLFLDGDQPDSIIGPIEGLSGRIRLNSIFDSNTEDGGPEHFGEDLQSLVDAFDQKRLFGADTSLSPEQSIMDFSRNSIGWLEGLCSDANKDAKYHSIMFLHASEALSNGTGVNTDGEMVLMLQLEQTYAATTRIISTVGKMLDDLMIAIR